MFCNRLAEDKTNDCINLAGLISTIFKKKYLLRH